MASELRVNTLKDASGNNSIATSFVANGRSKAGGVLDGAASTPAFDDSFNCASVADGGTGDYVITYTSNMASASHSTPMGILDTAVTVRCNEGRTSSTVQIQPLNTSNSAVDEDGISMTAHGDLA